MPSFQPYVLIILREPLGTEALHRIPDLRAASSRSFTPSRTLRRDSLPLPPPPPCSSHFPPFLGLLLPLLCAGCSLRSPSRGLLGARLPSSLSWVACPPSASPLLSHQPLPRPPRAPRTPWASRGGPEPLELAHLPPGCSRPGGIQPLDLSAPRTPRERTFRVAGGRGPFGGGPGWGRAGPSEAVGPGVASGRDPRGPEGVRCAWACGPSSAGASSS